MIGRYVETVSTYAGDIDNLILLIGVLVGFWLILCEVIFFGLIWRFRDKPGAKGQYITGEDFRYVWASGKHSMGRHGKKEIAGPHSAGTISFR